MEWIFFVSNFFIGSCLASHAAVVCDRFGNSDFILARSRCATCYMELSLLDELPIISYFCLRGKCRYCHSKIPVKLPIIEILGGFAFCKLDFSSSCGLFSAVLLFCLLLAAIYDYDHQEFHLVMLLPAMLLALLQIGKISHYQFLDWLELLPILFILLFYICQDKLGSGDLLIYLILVAFFNPHFTNMVLLWGALFMLAQFLLERKTLTTKTPIAFVPYLFLGVITELLFL